MFYSTELDSGEMGSHSFTHIYRENVTYNQRNQISCERCSRIARNAVEYCAVPETKAGRVGPEGTEVDAPV